MEKARDCEERSCPIAGRFIAIWLSARDGEALGDGAGRLHPVARKTSARTVIGIVIWLAVAVGATIQMTRYSQSAGGGGATPFSWPQESAIHFDGQRPTLVMFAHPRCPCTRASLGELERLVAKVPGRVSVNVVFLKPQGMAEQWEKTDLWQKASSIPGVAVYTDTNGKEARRFHAETSGQTVVYDLNGKLQFQGGITLARGHEGDNAGRSAIQQLLQEGHSTQVQTPVFGCALFESQCQEGKTICKR